MCRVNRALVACDICIFYYSHPLYHNLCLLLSSVLLLPLYYEFSAVLPSSSELSCSVEARECLSVCSAPTCGSCICPLSPTFSGRSYFTIPLTISVLGTEPCRNSVRECLLACIVLPSLCFDLSALLRSLVLLAGLGKTPLARNYMLLYLHHAPPDHVCAECFLPVSSGDPSCGTSLVTFTLVK